MIFQPTFDFSNSVFDFQNEIDMDLTHVTASVVGGQQYSRPGHSDIYHGRTRLTARKAEGNNLAFKE